MGGANSKSTINNSIHQSLSTDINVGQTTNSQTSCINTAFVDNTGAGACTKSCKGSKIKNNNSCTAVKNGSKKYKNLDATITQYCNGLLDSSTCTRERDDSGNPLCTWKPTSGAVSVSCPADSGRPTININQSCDVKSTISSAQSSQIQVQSNQSLSNTLQATASAKGQNMSLAAPTTADATVNSSIDLSNALKLAVSQTTTGSQKTLNDADVFACGADIIINQKGTEMADIISNQTNKIGTEQTQKLVNNVSATAKAVQENAIFSVLIALAILLLVIFLGPPIGVAIAGAAFASSMVAILVKIVIVGLLVFLLYLIFGSCLSKSYPCWNQCLNSEVVGSTSTLAALSASKCCATGGSNAKGKDLKKDAKGKDDRWNIIFTCHPPFDIASGTYNADRQNKPFDSKYFAVLVNGDGSGTNVTADINSVIDALGKDTPSISKVNDGAVKKLLTDNKNAAWNVLVARKNTGASHQEKFRQISTYLGITVIEPTMTKPGGSDVYIPALYSLTGVPGLTMTESNLTKICNDLDGVPMVRNSGGATADGVEKFRAPRCGIGKDGKVSANCSGSTGSIDYGTSEWKFCKDSNDGKPENYILPGATSDANIFNIGGEPPNRGMHGQTCSWPGGSGKGEKRGTCKAFPTWPYIITAVVFLLIIIALVYSVVRKYLFPPEDNTRRKRQ